MPAPVPGTFDDDREHWEQEPEFLQKDFGKIAVLVTG